VEAEFIRDVQAGHSRKELSGRFGVVPRTISEWKRKLREAGRLRDNAQPFEHALDEWQSKIDKPTWREILAHAEQGAELQERLRPIHTRATRTIRTDKPIFVVHIADLHLGAASTDYQAFLNTTDLLKSDPRFHFVIVGADLETAFAWFRSAEAVLSQVIPPWMQIEVEHQWLDEMLPRCIAICGDNHTDERLERVLGDIGLVWREDLPYFRTWGILDIELDNGRGDPVVYQAMLAHRWKGGSIYHSLQPALRMMRNYPNADWYCTAHTHKPAHMWGCFFEGREPQDLIVTGTFKTGDDLYVLRNFGQRGVLGLPTMKLWPDRKETQWFKSPQLALEG